MDFELITRADPESDTLLLQMVDDHDLELIENEVSHIREMSGGQEFCLMAVKVRNWNKDLSPWPAPAAYGNEDFGDGAAETLKFILEDLLPRTEDKSSNPPKKIFIGGYSLAGLFALWGASGLSA